MSDGPYRVGSIQQLTSSSALQTGMSDADTKKLRAALAAKDAEIERLRAVVQEVHDDCILRARTDRNGDKIVPIGRSVWIDVCAALENSHE